MSKLSTCIHRKVDITVPHLEEQKTQDFCTVKHGNMALIVLFSPSE